MSLMCRDVRGAGTKQKLLQPGFLQLPKGPGRVQGQSPARGLVKDNCCLQPLELQISTFLHSSHTTKYAILLNLLNCEFTNILAFKANHHFPRT